MPKLNFRFTVRSVGAALFGAVLISFALYSAHRNHEVSQVAALNIPNGAQARALSASTAVPKDDQEKAAEAPTSANHLRVAARSASVREVTSISNDRVSDAGVALNISQLAALDLSEVWDAVPMRSLDDPRYISDCMILNCLNYAPDLPGGRYSQDPTNEAFSLDHVAYFGAVCGPLIDRIGNPKVNIATWQVATKKCDGRGRGRAQNDFNNLTEQLATGRVSDETLSEILLNSDEALLVKVEAIDRALRDRRLLDGLVWDELRGELFEHNRMKLASLIAAKLYCQEPRACRSRSFLLFQLCSINAALDCKVNSDLTQIARDSLTPREYRWWENATLPSEKD